MDEYSININISRNEDEGLGFASTTDVERSVSVSADIGKKTVEVKHEPDSDIDDAITAFLNELGIEEIEL